MNRKLILVFICIFLNIFLIADSVVLALTKISLIHINDVHDRYLSYPEKDASNQIGGFAKLQTILNDIRKRNQEEGRYSLFVLAGDLLTGTPFSMVFKGSMGVELLNKMDLSAMVVGNHEFDQGLLNLISLQKQANFPFLSANIHDESGKLLFTPYIIKNIPETALSLALIGLTTQQTPITTNPKNVVGLKFKDPVDTAARIVKTLPQSNLIIVLSHLGVRTDKRLAEKVPEIQLIVGGHSHTALFEPIQVHNTLIIQAGAYTKYIGVLDLDIQDGKISHHSGKLIPIDARIPENPQMAELIQTYKKQLNADLDNIIGQTQIDLVRPRSQTQDQSALNLGKLICYVVDKSIKADAVLLNTGSIRSNILAGNITLSDIYTALPFGSTVVQLELPGSDVSSILERSEKMSESSGGKLQMSGIDYEVMDGNLIIKRIGNKDYHPDAIYVIATNDFLAAGGDGYSVFRRKGQNIIDTGTLIADLLAEFIEKNKVISPATTKQ